MNNIGEALQAFMPKLPDKKSKSTGKRERRNIILDQLIGLTGVKDIWRKLIWKGSQIPTEFLEDWYRMSLMEFTHSKRKDKFYQYLKAYKEENK